MHDAIYPPHVPDLFWAKVDKAGPNGCWIWTGVKSNLGYGYCWIRWVRRNRSQMAHRIAYELVRGEIPEGLHLDHLCRNPSCVNPDHLEPVTHRENIRRSVPYRPHVHWWERTDRVPDGSRSCPQGHLYDEGNTFVNRAGHFVCRACRAEAQRRARARRKAQRDPA